ncbi:MAG: phosphomannomutase, partial [Pseudomonadota bacterium]
MAPKFGTSGLRGLVVELTGPLCAGYAEAFLGLTKTNGTVLIGRDLRASSPRIAAAVAGGAERLGLKAIDCGVLPTPALALTATALGTAAVMITGSHIPDDRNGLKFYTVDGEITKADEAAISEARALHKDRAAAPGRLSPDASALERYKARFTGFFAPDALAGLRIGVYEHSSAAREVLPIVLEALGAETVRLGRAEAFVPVDTEAVDPATRDMLAAWSDNHRLDAVVSTDGDADRPMVTDAAGRIVPGDILGPLSARYLGADVVVTPVSSNTLVDLMGDFRVRRTRIGSPYVIEDMAAEARARVVGYEANGGFLTGFAATRDGRALPPLPTRDSVLPILCPLALAREHGATLAELVEDLPPRRTAADRLTEIPTETSAELVGRLQSSAELRATLCPGLGSLVDTDVTDGCRMHFGSGATVHLRPSGNAPELRVYVEADTQSDADDILADVLAR